MEIYFWGAILRLVQVLIYSAPWVVFGFVIAGIFDQLVGVQRTQKLFGGSGIKGIFQGWAWGMLIPVCSLGVIPIVLQLHKSKIRGGTLISFALTAPLFNPLSVLYGLTLSDPIAIIAFAFCSLLIVSSVGLLWDWIFPVTEESEPAKEQPMVANGIRRMVAVAQSSCSLFSSQVLVYLLIGIFGSVLLSVVLPHGVMSTMLERGNMAAPALVAALGTAVYSTPLLSMSQIGTMFQHGNSIGAAFSLLIFGAGINFGLIACFWRFYGLKKVATFFALLLVVSLSLAYLISEPLFPKGVEVAGHTHAFDVYTNPYHHSSQNLPAMTLNRVQKHWGNHEFGGSFMLIGLILTEAVFIFLKKKEWFGSWIQAPATPSSLDFEIPERVLFGLSVFGLILSSVFGCYVYYPSSEDVLRDMTSFNADAISAARSGNWEGAKKWISYQEDLSRRLEVGSFIRTGELSEYRRTKATLFRDSLENLKHAIEDEDKEQVAKLSMRSNQTFRRMRKAFQNPSSH